MNQHNRAAEWMSEASIEPAADTSRMLEKLGPAEREEARRLADSLLADDPNRIMEFGTGVQQNIAEFAGTLLAQVKTRDAGDLGVLITELIERIDTVKKPNDEKQGRTLSRLPVVGALIRSARRTVRNAKTVESQVDAIRARMDEAYVGLHRDMEMLEIVQKKNYEFFKDLELHIAALQIRLEQAETEELPQMRKRTEISDDPWAVQKASEHEAFIRSLEKRLDDFKRTRFLSLSHAPRIRLLQQGEQLVMEKIQSVIYHLIPLWKMDLVTGLAEERASRALELQTRVSEHIELGMRRSAERMREATVGIARESESGMVSMDTLRSVHTELLVALEETKRIYAEGKKQRQEAERELSEMERELKLKLTEAVRPGA